MAARIDLAGCSITNAAGRMPGQCATADHTLIRALKAHSGIRRGTLVWDSGMKLDGFALKIFGDSLTFPGTQPAALDFHFYLSACYDCVCCEDGSTV